MVHHGLVRVLNNPNITVLYNGRLFSLFDRPYMFYVAFVTHISYFTCLFHVTPFPNMVHVSRDLESPPKRFRKYKSRLQTTVRLRDRLLSFLQNVYRDLKTRLCQLEKKWAFWNKVLKILNLIFSIIITWFKSFPFDS